MNGWKITAIIFIILFVLETSLWIWGIYAYQKEEENKYVCYYEVCEDYPHANFEGVVCSCYDYDLMGRLTIVKEKLLK